MERSSATKLHIKMLSVLNESVPSFIAISLCVLEIESGRTTVEDEPQNQPKHQQHQKSSSRYIILLVKIQF